jgi:hypothetical protein
MVHLITILPVCIDELDMLIVKHDVLSVLFLILLSCHHLLNTIMLVQWFLKIKKNDSLMEN